MAHGTVCTHDRFLQRLHVSIAYKRRAAVLSGLRNGNCRLKADVQ